MDLWKALKLARLWQTTLARRTVRVGVGADGTFRVLAQGLSERDARAVIATVRGLRWECPSCRAMVAEDGICVKCGTGIARNAMTAESWRTLWMKGWRPPSDDDDPDSNGVAGAHGDRSAVTFS